MTQDITPILRDWLHEPDSLSPPRIAEVRPLVHQTPQQRGFLPPIFTGRFQTMFSATKFVVAGVIVALFGGFMLSGVLTQRSDEPLPAVGASASAQAEPTEASTSAPEPTAQAEDVEGTGPVLAWEAVTEEEVQRMRASEAADQRSVAAGLTFSDGSAVEWQHVGHGFKVAVRDGKVVRGKDKVPVGFRPLEIVVERPDGTIATSTIEKPLRLSSPVAISPAGVLLGTGFKMDDRDLVRLVTQRESVGRWLVRNRSRSPCCRVTEDGVVRIGRGYRGMPAGDHEPEAMADELRVIGLAPADARAYDNGHGHAGAWFSADGESWRRVDAAWPRKSARMPQLLGSGDGFYVASRRWLFFSSDADTWEFVPGADTWEFVPGSGTGRTGLWEWQGKVIGVDQPEDGRFQLVEISPSGKTDLPIPALTMSVSPTALGLFGYDHADRLIFFSPDGLRWSLSPAPDEWGLGDGESHEVGPLPLGSEILMFRFLDSGPWFRAVVRE